MSVFCAVNASLMFVLMMSPQFDTLSTVMKVIIPTMYAVLFLSGIFCESKTQDKIAKLEKEIDKLKENSKS